MPHSEPNDHGNGVAGSGETQSRQSFDESSNEISWKMS